MSETGTTATTTTTTTAADKPWFDGAAPEEIGYLQNRGEDKKTAREAALAAGKSHREAEKLLGAPADKIVRLPNDPNDAEGWRQVQRKLGAPADAKEYDFSTVKFSDGSPLDDKFVSLMREQAIGLGLSKDKAAAHVQAVVKFMDAAENADATEMQGKIAAEKTKLATNWGPNYEANLFVAKQAATKLGVTSEELTALGNTIGFAKTMELFRNVGTKIGEDKFVLSQAPGGNGIMTKEQAVDRKSSLMKDEVWVKAYLGGDAAKKAEMTALNTMIVG